MLGSSPHVRPRHPPPRADPQLAQPAGSRPAGRRAAAGVDRRRAVQRGEAGLGPPVLHLEGQRRAGALRDVQDESLRAALSPGRRHAGAAARQGRPVRTARRVPTGRRIHGAGRRRRAAARVRAAQGPARCRRPVRPGAQACPAPLRTAHRRGHLGHRRGDPRRAERAGAALAIG